MKIAVVKYSTYNLGDDIQSIALERLLPRVDLRIDRDYLGPAAEWGDDVRWIINGWYASGNHSVWPPPGNARKLFVGFHATDVGIIPRNQPLPLGCRDPWTVLQCCRHQVDAWLSYCCTLTLSPVDQPKREDVLLVDVPERYLSQLPPEIADGTRLSHSIARDCDRTRIATDYLQRYAHARWVVTNRVHVLLPCAAMGTPVVFIRPDKTANRFAAYTHLAWTLDNAPWDTPQPRYSSEFVHSMTIPLREVVERFLRS